MADRRYVTHCSAGFPPSCSWLLRILACTLIVVWAAAARAEETRIDEETGTKPAPESDYHPPMAGEECDISFMGRSVHIPARNCDNVLSLTLGGILYTPQLGSNSALPLAALYWRHRWENTRVRSVVAIFDNELDVARSLGKFELVGHLENETIPFPMTEIVNGREVKQSSIEWGTFSGWLGAGWRRPVPPFQYSSDLTAQLFYHAGYLYSKPVAETSSNVRLPPDTLVHGIRVRARYDGFRRNLLELPHDGWACGMDLEVTRRDRWSDANYGNSFFKGDDTRNYIKFSGYLSGSMGIPKLSERNRLLASVYGGFAPDSNLDRFSAFRISGGPFPSETVDIYRHPYPGALFKQFPVAEYMTGTVEYRREILAFLFLHLRETFVWANRISFTSQPQKFFKVSGEAFSVGLTSGFFWNSQLYMEYTHDNGFIRNGPAGESLLALWSKSF